LRCWKHLVDEDYRVRIQEIVHEIKETA